MSGKKKKEVRKNQKKGGKYDITIQVDASFEELLKAGLSHNPKEKQEAAKKD